MSGSLANEEAWLRGPLSNVDPLLAPALLSFTQAREDLGRWTEGLTTAQLWRQAPGATTIGFHLRHIAGSVERLYTYLQEQDLSAAQLAAMQRENEPGAPLQDLLAEIDRVFAWAGNIVRGLNIADLRDARFVGRKQLPSSVIGILHHAAEHTQRHVGEAIVIAKTLRA